ncbi:MAG: BtpA/SgcQ family protein [Patescibacteria group bacterium]
MFFDSLNLGLQNGSRAIGVIHVASTNALQNTQSIYRKCNATYTNEELIHLNSIRKKILKLHRDLISEYSLDEKFLSPAAVCLLKPEMISIIQVELMKINFIHNIVDRALAEVDLYIKQGIKIVEIENIGTPYLLDQMILPEDYLILHLVACKIRKLHKSLVIGINILANGEMHSLPIAISVEAYFIHSDSSMFVGVRPEGETINNGKLARLLYMRNFYQTICGNVDPKSRLYPKIWCDLKKKYTFFNQSLESVSAWISFIRFMKIEGLVLSSSEADGTLNEKYLLDVRMELNKVHSKIIKTTGDDQEIPLIIGSGFSKNYKEYADFVILGGVLKKNGYWENDVDEKRLSDILSTF